MGIRAEEAAAGPQLELLVKFDFAALGLAFKKEAMAAKAAVLALSEQESLALQASLDTNGEATVGGYKITSLMVTLKMVEKKGSLPRNASSTSVSSLAKSRNASSTSLATSTDGASATASTMSSRIGSAVDLSDMDVEPPKKKKASPEEIKVAAARIAAAGAALKDAIAAAAAAGIDTASDATVLAAQAEMKEAKEAKASLMKAK